MEESRKPRRERMAQPDALAEIQARLERCEDDLTLAADQEAPLSDRHAASLSEEADEIEGLLEDLMAPDGPDQQDEPEQQNRRDPNPDLNAVFRREEEAAARLAESEAARKAVATPHSGASSGPQVR